METLYDEFIWRDEPPMPGVMGALGLGALREVSHAKGWDDDDGGAVQQHPQRPQQEMRRPAPAREKSVSTEAMLRRLMRQQQQQQPYSHPSVDSSMSRQAEDHNLLNSMPSDSLGGGHEGHGSTYGRATASGLSSGMKDARESSQRGSGVNHVPADARPYQQLYVQDPSGRLIPVPRTSMMGSVQGIPGPAPAQQFVMGPGGEWLMLAQPAWQAQAHQAAQRPSWWNGSEICLLAVGGIMIMLNILAVAYALMMRFLLKEMKSLVQPM